MPEVNERAFAGDGPLRAAVIGYGLAGSAFHAPLIAATAGMRLAAVVTGNQSRQAAARAAYPEAAILGSVDELWQRAGELDLVVVATPNRSHVPLGMAAIDLGVPAVIDKPLAPSVREARRLIEASNARGVPLTVFQNRRWDGDFRTVRAIIDEDLLGPLVRYESRFERYRPAPREGAWRERGDPEEAGGLIFDIGSHLIDQALLLFGYPECVYAELGRRRPGVTVDDDTFISLQFASGLQAHLWMSVVARTPGPRFVVGGLRGAYTKYGLDPQEATLRRGERPGGTDWGEEPPEAWGRISTDVGSVHLDGAIETLPGQYERFYSQFAGALRNGSPLPVDPHDALRTLEVIEAALRSAQEGRVAALEPAAS